MFLEGPNGPIDLRTLDRHSVDSVPPMATSNVSFDFVDGLAEVAGNGGEGIQSLGGGSSMPSTMSLEAMVASLDATWFPEDWPPLIRSAFMQWFGKHACAGD